MQDEAIVQAVGRVAGGVQGVGGLVSLYAFDSRTSGDFRPATLYIRENGLQTQHQGRMFGLGQRRSITFALPTRDGSHVDMMRLSWFRDGTLQGAMYTLREAQVLRELHQRRGSARSEIVRAAVAKELDAMFDRCGREVRMTVEYGLDVVVPADLSRIRKEMLAGSPGL